ncbi:MAG: IS21 family transposase [Deltaproteobacteria bacterium]|nr:IS21 family transposase [Deltaproteobacteria bacterium]
MRKIRDVLRLHFLGGIESSRQIGRAVGCGKTAVLDLLRRAPGLGIQGWADVEALGEAELEELFYRDAIAARGPGSQSQPDWKMIHEELRRRDHQVTLALLWTEYKAENPTGYQYSRFAELYRRWAKRLSLVMRQNHRPGEKAFVDFCDGVAIVNPLTGESVPTQLFVGALGASSYTFCVATLSQELPVFLDCHVGMYKFFDGVTAITVPDNLRSAVKKADRYEAEINRSYQDLAEHYGTCVIPARVRKPRDKAKAEAAVLVAQRWILAVLRHRTFYSLQELNEAIAALLEKLNARVMRHVKQSRRELYERLDRPALKPLPASAYEWSEWKKVRLNIDYHVAFDDHYYSAPYTLYQEELWIRAGHPTIEIFHKGKRVASHVRAFVKGGYSTTPEHRPASHRAHAEWTPSRIIGWGKTIGPQTAQLIERVIADKPHPEQGYRSALGIIRLADKFGKDRLEKAAEKAVSIGSPSYQTVHTMLKRRMEAVAPAATDAQARDEKQLELLAKENIRGQGYYH